VNLVAPGVALMELRMVDTCVITRDNQQFEDDVLDETTLELIPPYNDNYQVYVGKCMFTSETRKDVNIIQGEDPIARKMFLARIPVSHTDVFIGDVITLTDVAEDNDRWLLDRPMRIGKVSGGTYSTSRHLHCELIEQDKGNFSG
jgi:hypothetical protein